MRRTFIAAAAAAVLATGPLTATAATAAAEPTSVSVTDTKNDMQNPKGKKVSHDLDVRRVSATLDGENVLVRLKVADLRAKHLKSTDIGGGMYQNDYALDAVVNFGGKARWFVGWNAYPDATDASVSGKNSDCDDENGSRYLQEADLAQDVLIFTMPTDCLPAAKTEMRVSGDTNWSTDAGFFIDGVWTKTHKWKWSPFLTYQ